MSVGALKLRTPKPRFLVDRLPCPTLAVVAVERDVPRTGISVKEKHGLVVWDEGLTATKASVSDVLGCGATTLASFLISRVVTSAVLAFDMGAHVGWEVRILTKLGVASHARLVMVLLVVFGRAAHPTYDGAVGVGESKT